MFQRVERFIEIQKEKKAIITNQIGVINNIKN